MLYLLSDSGALCCALLVSDGGAQIEVEAQMASQVAGAGQGRALRGSWQGRAVLVGQVVTSKPEQLAYSPTNLESLRLGMKRPV